MVPLAQPLHVEVSLVAVVSPVMRLGFRLTAHAARLSHQLASRDRLASLGAHLVLEPVALITALLRRLSGCLARAVLARGANTRAHVVLPAMELGDGQHSVALSAALGLGMFGHHFVITEAAPGFCQ